MNSKTYAKRTGTTTTAPHPPPDKAPLRHLCGWVTGGTAAKLADEAATRALIPVCAEAMLADPVAVEALKAKRAVDYEDVVRDVWKPVGFTAPSSYQFRRDCGVAIQAIMAKAATKS